jgi:hemerythrin-like metal-binding protein
MPMRMPWDPEFNTGQPDIDTQHQALLAQCNRLAELCPAEVDATEAPAFDEACEDLKALARAHFDAELALLSAGNCAELEDHRADCEEFEYLASEIATAENFSRLELQRFLALWWLGHIKGAVLAPGARP